MERMWFIRWGVGSRKTRRFKHEEAAKEAARKIANETGRPVEYGIGYTRIGDILPERKDD